MRRSSPPIVLMSRKQGVGGVHYKFITWTERTCCNENAPYCLTTRFFSNRAMRGGAKMKSSIKRFSTMRISNTTEVLRHVVIARIDAMRSDRLSWRRLTRNLFSSGNPQPVSKQFGYAGLPQSPQAGALCCGFEHPRHAMLRYPVAITCWTGAKARLRSRLVPFAAKPSTDSLTRT